jgi:peptidyl-prolyl cis-trans isomerase SurA
MKMLQKRTISKFLTASLFSCLLFLITPVLAQEGFVVDKIIAKVDNYIVLKSELELGYQGYLAEGNAANEEAKCEIFNRLILNKLMVAKAEIDSVVVLDPEVDATTEQRMGMILQNSGNSPEQLERTYGKTLEQIKVELREQIREQLLAREMTARITKDLTVTPSEIKKFYSKIPKDSLPFFSSDVEVAQIVRVAKVSESQEQLTIARLHDLRERILKGENFTELAMKNSDDPSAQYNGGEMGYVGRGAMVPQFEAQAFKLKLGEISQPFKSSFGFHIMQLIDRRGNEYNSRHILIFATPSADDIAGAGKFLDSIREKIIDEKLKFEQMAKEYSDDDATKGMGGFFTDADGSIKISLRDIDPVVYINIDTMKVGNISKPLTYRTDDGKDAVRILYYKKKLPPHEANLKDDWNRIQSAALAEKKDNALEKWFAMARKDVFINIDPTYNFCKILQ